MTTEKRKLICFDVDGTLIDETTYIWVTIHDFFNISKELRALHFDCFLNKHITYSEWFMLDILEWQKKGVKKKDLIHVIKKLKVMSGAYKTLSALREAGFIIAIISGSLNIVMETLMPDFIFDDIFLNRIFFNEKGFIKNGIPTPYDMEKKTEALYYLLNKYKLKKEDSFFVGDNFNDIEIARSAGISISFNSKSEKLNQVSDIVIKEKDLEQILKHIL